MPFPLNLTLSVRERRLARTPGAAVIFNVGQNRTKIVPALATALVLLFVAACEWPEPPLSKPNADTDPILIGDWTSIGERKLRLKITRAEARMYEVILRGGPEKKETVMHFRGYHTDIGGIRIVSMEILEVHYPDEMKRLPDGPQHRWICLSYTIAEDGSLEPRFLSREVLPKCDSSADMLLVTGKRLYDNLRVYAASPFFKEHFFDTSVERMVFRKETDKSRE